MSIHGSSGILNHGSADASNCLLCRPTTVHAPGHTAHVVARWGAGEHGELAQLLGRRELQRRLFFAEQLPRGFVVADARCRGPGDHTYPQLRSVKWDGNVLRDNLFVATRNSLGAIATLFQLSAEAAEEIEKLASGTAVAPQIAATGVEEETQVDLIYKDIQSKAFEFIKDKISQLD
jgi:hypothetical protein